MFFSLLPGHRDVSPFVLPHPPIKMLDLITDLETRRLGNHGLKYLKLRVQINLYFIKLFSSGVVQ